MRKRAHTQLVREHSSQLAELMWTDPGLKRGISARELISIEKKKKVVAGINDRTVLPKYSLSPPPPQC